MSIPIDCMCIVVEFLQTREWLQLSYTCSEINNIKFDKRLMVHKRRTAKQMCTDDMLKAAEGTLFNVSVANCAQLTAAAFSHMCGTIHTLDMSACAQVPQVQILAQMCETLVYLDMSYCKNVVDLTSIIRTLSTAKHLESLFMLNCDSAFIDLQEFCNFSKLSVLDVTGCRLCAVVTEIGTQQIVALGRRVALYGARNLSETLCKDGYRHLAQAEASKFEDKQSLKLASRHFLDSVAVDRGNPDPLVGTAYILLLLGNNDHAMMYLKEALRVDPGHEDAIKLVNHVTNKSSE